VLVGKPEGTGGDREQLDLTEPKNRFYNTYSTRYGMKSQLPKSRVYQEHLSKQETSSVTFL